MVICRPWEAVSFCSVIMTCLMHNSLLYAISPSKTTSPWPTMQGLCRLRHPPQCSCLQLQLICQQPSPPSPYCALSVSSVPALCSLHTLSLKSSFLINPHLTPGDLHFTFNNPAQTLSSPKSGPKELNTSLHSHYSLYMLILKPLLPSVITCLFTYFSPFIEWIPSRQTLYYLFLYSVLGLHYAHARHLGNVLGKDN